MRIDASEAWPHPSGHGHEDVEVARAAELHRPLDLVLEVAQLARSVAVATYGMPCAIAIAGTFLPCPKAFPGCSPTAMVVAVRAAGGVAEERCTPVFMYASLS